MGYPPIVMPETLKEWKVAITSVGQWYKSTEGWHNYKTSTGMTYGEVIDKLKEAKYFNKLDLIWGYNNVWIKEGDEWKAAFLTNKGLFKP